MPSGPADQPGMVQPPRGDPVAERGFGSRVPEERRLLAGMRRAFELVRLGKLVRQPAWAHPDRLLGGQIGRKAGFDGRPDALLDRVGVLARVDHEASLGLLPPRSPGMPAAAAR